jgi:hypothetical protein
MKLHLAQRHNEDHGSDLDFMVLLPPDSIEDDFNIADYQQVWAE